ncbi:MULTISPECIES: GNAT family N-acetyltransferase [unclassified Streptomyces]|uniref:GNAT family N-acetyltransferase n=1 Tax=unclassified Streptomyces TaxID=2593676 RepID=UPI0035DDA430
MIPDTHRLDAGIRLRPTVPSDAASLAVSLARSRAYMQPWEPIRPDAFYTEEGQRERLVALFGDRDAGRAAPWVLADEEDRAVGGFNLSGIVLGPLRSGTLGYWVDVEYAGRGLATAAVRLICEMARDGLGLHRIEAGTVLENAASQRVLAKCGFEEYGTAPQYLYINGQWRDHRLFQRILHDGPPKDLPTAGRG